MSRLFDDSKHYFIVKRANPWINERRNEGLGVNMMAPYGLSVNKADMSSRNQTQIIREPIIYRKPEQHTHIPTWNSNLNDNRFHSTVRVMQNRRETVPPPREVKSCRVESVTIVENTPTRARAQTTIEVSVAEPIAEKISKHETPSVVKPAEKKNTTITATKTSTKTSTTVTKTTVAPQQQQQQQNSVVTKLVSLPKYNYESMDNQPTVAPSTMVSLDKMPKAVEKPKKKSYYDEDIEEQLEIESPSYITCYFGLIRGKIPIVDNKFGELEVQNALSFQDKQLLYINIKGIRERTGAKRLFPFIRDSKLYSLARFDSIYMSALSEEIEYDLVTEDLRVHQIDELTPKEIAALRREFDRIDKTKVGALNIEDIRNYFEQRKQDLILDSRRNTSREDFENRVKQLERLFTLKSDIMIERANGNDGKIITFAEFMYFCGMDLIKSRWNS
jgi:hypothetical protein